MGTRTEAALSKSLEPGDEIFCEHCSQKSQAVLNDSMIECMICLVQIQEYDLVDHDRVQLDEDGRMSGRGGSVKLGKRPSRTRIGKSRGRAGNGRSWSYLERVNGGGVDGGPTRSKKEAVRLVERHSATREHERCALELLDLGWPDGRQAKPHPMAVEGPIWRPAHPHGVGSSAAACLHLAAEEMGFDSKFQSWAELCLPNAKNPVTFGFRSLKRMRSILRACGRGRVSSREYANAILSRANLGGTIYGAISARVWESWLECERTEDNLESHPRQVLAAICHVIAVDEGLPVRPGLIMERFDVGRSYQNWIPKVGRPRGPAC